LVKFLLARVAEYSDFGPIERFISETVAFGAEVVEDTPILFATEM